jgi:hypothetical protein
MNRLKINFLKGAFLMIAMSAFTAFGQPSFGVMEFTNKVDGLYWWHATVASELQGYLTQELRTFGTGQSLSREHILLLLKEVDPPDLDDLEEDVIKEIGRHEQLKYLVTGELESFEVKDVKVIYVIRLIIYKTEDGKIVWQDAPEVIKDLKGKEINDKILLEKAFKPTLLEMTKEIKKLNLQ